MVDRDKYENYVNDKGVAIKITPIAFVFFTHSLTLIL